MCDMRRVLRRGPVDAAARGRGRGPVRRSSNTRAQHPDPRRGSRTTSIPPVAAVAIALSRVALAATPIVPPVAVVATAPVAVVIPPVAPLVTTLVYVLVAPIALVTTLAFLIVSSLLVAAFLISTLLF
jgi:hypothetical protein